MMTEVEKERGEEGKEKAKGKEQEDEEADKRTWIHRPTMVSQNVGGRGALTLSPR